MNVRYLVVSLILGLSLILSTGCGLLPATDTSPSTSSAPVASPIDSDWTLPPPGSQATELPSIADVVARVKPSVVAISTEVVIYDFFNRPFTQEGAGSGWIISEDGIIITNNHVVEGAKSITITLDDGRTFLVDMNAVTTDRLTDLAVLKIDAENLPAATVGDSSALRVGDWVIAIGNSLGLGISATHGIVSRKEVSLEVDIDQTLYDLIQTNAAINPGDSGGPLVNMAGEVIGITSAKISAAGVEGMGYAISSEVANPVIQELIKRGYVVRPWAGLGALTVNPTVVFWYDLVVDKGALVSRVSRGSPASKAGLQPGDVIVGFDGEEIASVHQLTRAIHSCEIGQEIEITFWRGDTKRNTKVVLVESLPLP